MPRKLRRQIDQRASRSCHRNPLVLGPLPVAEVATAVNADPTPSMAPIRGNRDMDEWWSSSLPLSSDVDPEDSPELGSAPMAEDRFGAARQNGRGPPAASRESRPSHREDPTPEPVKAPRPDSAIDLVRGETGIEKLATSDDTVLVLSEPPDLTRISSTFPAHSQESADDPKFAPRRDHGHGGRSRLQAERRKQALLGFARDLGDHLDVALERGAAELRREEVVDLEDARGVVHLDLDPNGALLPSLDSHLVDRRRGEGMDAVLTALDRDARAPLRHVEGIGDAHHPRLNGVRLTPAP